MVKAGRRSAGVIMNDLAKEVVGGSVQHLEMLFRQSVSILLDKPLTFICDIGSVMRDDESCATEP